MLIIFLDPKKGVVCHRLLDCGHVFCLECLKDFYTSAIEQGELATVRCLAPNCAKERTSNTTGQEKRRKPKTFISPSELLQIGLPMEMVTRYVSLKYKTELESDKNTIYCPRSWCNGAARSKKHKKPEGIEFEESSDHDSDGEAGEGASKPTFLKGADLLSICEDCGLAFCSRCYQSWHGEFVSCTPRRDNAELTEEEQASLDYINLHTTPCPTCAAPAQKTHGCNHMICFRCNTHFCYLCSAWLSPDNPYRHFNKQENGKVTSCYMRLWELEAGDGDDVDNGFAGGARLRGVNQEPQVVNIIPEIEEPDDTDDSELEDEFDDGDDVQGGAEQVAVAREGPLVLRIGGDLPQRGVGGQRGRRRPVPPAAPAAPIAAQAPRGRGANRARGGRGRGNRGMGQMGRRGGGGPRQNQQHENQAAQQQQQQQQARQPLNNDDIPEGARELDPQQREWIRNFVHMALIDQEDEIEWDSDDENDAIEFRIN
jgi:E3 ubiquitin-protein ligase RNF14